MACFSIRPRSAGSQRRGVGILQTLLPTLLSACRDVLSPNPLFVMLTAYAVKASAITLQNGLAEITSHLKGQVSGGESAWSKKARGGSSLQPSMPAGMRTIPSPPSIL